MKRLFFLLIVLSLSVVFGACPPLEEDEPDSFAFGNIITVDDPSLADDPKKPDTKLDVYKWFKILDKIAKERKYVSLDLSKGTYVEGNRAGGLIKATDDPDELIVFDPFPAASSGKNYILSIILPAEAKVIKQATEDSELATIGMVEGVVNEEAKEKDIKDIKKNSAFSYFTKLHSVRADNVTHIGNFAFADCMSLKEVYFPKAGHLPSDEELKNEVDYSTDIGGYAFLGCTGLKEVKFNEAAVIGEYAFKGCTNLIKIDFPAVWMIEKNAFEGCETLPDIYFENASKIKEKAFKDCKALKTAEFHVEPKRFFPSEPPILPGDEPVYDSVIFGSSVFYGCEALEVLYIRRAWNVYFFENVFANTGSAIEIYLFDEPEANSTSYGHPQKKDFLGTKDSSLVTVKKVDIFVPLEGKKIPANTIENIMKYIQQEYPTVDVSANPRSF